MTRAPILISGCPRSGTTFCGKIISNSPDVFEVYEPFNPDFTYPLDLPNKFFRIDAQNERIHKAKVDRMLGLGDLGRRLALLPRGGIERLVSNKDMASALALKKLVQDPESFFRAKRVSIKDPIAFYSAEWFATTYGAPVIMMCRHPGGVVSSYLNLGWEAETKYIVDHEWPSSKDKFAAEIAAWRKNPEDTVGAAILQWKLFTQASLDLKARYSNWVFCLHDQLCAEPVDVFRAIFDAVDLPFTNAIQSQIESDTGNTNIVDPKKHSQHNLKRQSAELINSWKKRIDDDTANRILRETGALWEEACDAFWIDV